MGRHTGDVPIEPGPGQPPYGLDGPPARLQAGYLRRNDAERALDDLGPRVRGVPDLTRWEKAVAWVPVLVLGAVFVLLLPAIGVPAGPAYWVGWALCHGPLVWAADRYAATHEPWNGPRRVHR